MVAGTLFWKGKTIIDHLRKTEYYRSDNVKQNPAKCAFSHSLGFYFSCFVLEQGTVCLGKHILMMRIVCLGKNTLLQMTSKILKNNLRVNIRQLKRTQWNNRDVCHYTVLFDPSQKYWINYHMFCSAWRTFLHHSGNIKRSLKSFPWMFLVYQKNYVNRAKCTRRAAGSIAMLYRCVSVHKFSFDLCLFP